MNFFSVFLEQYEDALHYFAVLIACTLELVGILVIMVGAFKALLHLIRRIRLPKNFNVFIDLGRTMALGLEFKMGSEIIRTVVIRDFEELAILGSVILICALLSFIVHWEIKVEKQSERE